MTADAIVVAGGSGERFGRADGKQMALVAGWPVVTHALRAFDACPSIDSVVLVCDPARVDEFRRGAVDAPGIRKVGAVVGGGATRRASVARGLAALGHRGRVVAVHDGARPLVDPDTIEAALEALEGSPDVDGVVVGHPSFDTVKEVDDEGRVVRTPDRERLWIAQTPQVFRTAALLEAHAAAERDGFEGTDDASLVERSGGRILLVEGSRWNIKVTVPGDLEVVEALLTAGARRGGADE